MAWDVMSGVTKMAWDVMSGVTKTAWDVLSGVANLCGMFCPGCKKMAWDVLSRDVLSGSLLRPTLQPFFGRLPLYLYLLWCGDTILLNHTPTEALQAFCMLLMI